MMGTEERMAHVEGLVAGHGQLLVDLRSSVTSLELRMDRRFEQMDGRLDAFEHRFETRLGAFQDSVDARFRSIDAAIATLRHDMIGHFRWQMGMMVTMFAVMVGAILAR